MADDARMPSTPNAGLLAFALATYNVTLLLVAAGLVVYLGGGLADALARIGTVAGIALFALLVGGTNACLRRIASEHSLTGTPRAAALLRAGARWGGVIGVVVLGAAPTAFLAFAALRELGLR
jgi:hypothetical protein